MTIDLIIAVAILAVFLTVLIGLLANLFREISPKRKKKPEIRRVK